MEQHFNSGESPMTTGTPERHLPAENAGGTDRGRVPTQEESRVAWDRVREANGKQQYTMLRRLSRVGQKGFHVVPSSQQASAGSSKDTSGFKPAQTKTG